MKGSIKTIEELLLYALSQMDRARAILATQDKSAWLPELYTADIYNRLEAIKTSKDTAIVYNHEHDGDRVVPGAFDEALNKDRYGRYENVGAFSFTNKAKGDTRSSAHSYTEGMDEAQIFNGKEIKHGWNPCDEFENCDCTNKCALKPSPFIPCNHCDESGCTFNCIGKRKNAVGPAVHPYPETKINDLAQAIAQTIKSFGLTVADAKSVLTMEQKVVAENKEWRKMAEDFLYKVDSGKAHSTHTYGIMKSILKRYK